MLTTTSSNNISRYVTENVLACTWLHHGPGTPSARFHDCSYSMRKHAERQLHPASDVPSLICTAQGFAHRLQQIPTTTVLYLLTA
jgi:hypothetical protein